MMFYLYYLHLSDLSGLVVTSEDSESVLEADLESDEESDSLDGVVATINIIAHEQVVGVGRVATNLEEFSQVVELTVDVTTDSHGGAHLLHVRLVDQDLFSLYNKEKENVKSVSTW